MDFGGIANVILTIVAAVASGGWFVNYKQKKQGDKVDLTDKILQKYQASVLEMMDNRFDYRKEMNAINMQLNNISQFLKNHFEDFH